MTSPKALVAGNWKMNGLLSSGSEFSALDQLVRDNGANCDVLICPPATLISSLANIGSEAVQLGGQDCHTAQTGAHTGDVSAEMLKDLGCAYVIVGHSERRTDHGETNETVNAKAVAGQSQDLIAIICVGETEAERDAGQAVEVVTSQVRASIPDSATSENTIIAYEPVWAIGTGRTPTTDDVAEMHEAIRGVLNERFGESGGSINILYGGSVKPANAKELMSVANVDGALVGGASLTADSFYGIIAAYD